MTEKEYFGFRKVDKSEKASMVYDVFESVASKYDIMNDLMSGGLHRLWKKKMVSEINLFSGAELLDVAGGTGDISFRLIEKAKRKDLDIFVTISDINEYMLEKCRERAINSNILSNIDWKIADAEKLPFEDNTFDFYTIAFGIRNVTNIDQALSEAYRVLKSGGKFVCLEFSHVDNTILSSIYDSFSFNVIPKIGEVVTGDRDSYQYLVESIRKFPAREVFSDMMRTADFSNIKCQPLTNGVVAIHSGYKT